jgi:hypothetical protein
MEKEEMMIIAFGSVIATACDPKSPSLQLFSLQLTVKNSRLFSLPNPSQARLVAMEIHPFEAIPPFTLRRKKHPAN